MHLTFDTCDSQHCVDVSIVDDLGAEPDEVIVFTLLNTYGLNPSITIRADSLGDDGKCLENLSV